MTKISSPRKARRRYHRAFFQWLHENQSRFLTAPFRIINRTDRIVTFTIPGLNPALSFKLSFGSSCCSLFPHVEWQGEWRDTPICFESELAGTPGRYYCGHCHEEGRKTYLSKEAFWIGHDFEPFLEWINTYLTQASWLVIDNCDNARMLSEPSPKAEFNMPLWIHKSDEQCNA